MTWLWIYEISLLFRIFSWNIFQHSKINLVSPKGHAYVMFYYYITNKKPNHFNEIENHFTAIYYVVIATVIFLHVRIPCHSRVWVCPVLTRKLTSGISMLYKRRVFCNVNKMSLTAVTQPRLMLQSAVPNSYKQCSNGVIHSKFTSHCSSKLSSSAKRA